jgi:hypothetical protein
MQREFSSQSHSLSVGDRNGEAEAKFVTEYSIARQMTRVNVRMLICIVGVDLK